MRKTEKLVSARVARDFSWYKIPRTGVNIPNYHKTYQMTSQYSNIQFTNIFHSKVLQNIPKLGFLLRKYIYHLATQPGIYSAVAFCQLVKNLRCTLTGG
jgi:hypothetical protein